MAAQIQPVGAEGFYGTKDQRDEGVQDKAGAGIHVTHSRNDASAQANPTLEAVAESKGRWFQYVKTKQFWITLLLGQGKENILSIPYHKTFPAKTQIANTGLQ